jgi:hypothetical protein
MSRALKVVQFLGKKSEQLIPFPIAIGQVTQSIDGNTRQVKVINMELDNYLKMYFNKSFEFETQDTSNLSKKGDIVLIRRMKNPPTSAKLYNVEKVLFKIDDIVDPVTGKKVGHDEELIKKHIESLSKSFGQSISN